MDREPLLVLSVHALDFVWRASGTIARYVAAGSPVKIIVLTFGEIGESAELWTSQEGITLEHVKAIRRAEAEEVAAILGAQIEFMDWGDQPLMSSESRIRELGRLIRDYRPSRILTHHTEDYLNPDHAVGAALIFQAVRCAQVHGIDPDIAPLKGASIYMFEPDQPEFCNFKPNTFVDISDVFDVKVKAMNAIKAQKFLIENYTQRSSYRGYLAGRQNGMRNISYAEAYMKFNSNVGRFLL